MLFSEGAEVYLIGEVVGTLSPDDVATPEEVERYQTLTATES